MLKWGLLVLIVAVMFYMGLGGDTPEKTVTAVHQTKTEQPKNAEPKKQEKTSVKTVSKHTLDTDSDMSKSTDIEVKKVDEVHEAEIAEMSEMKEEMEAIEPEERSEDYYDNSDTPRRKDLIGGADIEWIKPDKTEKSSGNFGMPPPVF